MNLIKSPRYCNYGDILVCNVSENEQDSGKAVAYLNKEMCLVGDAITVVKHRENPKYMAFVLSTYEYKKQVKKLVQKGIIFNFYSKDLMKIKIPLPSLKEQEEIVKILDLFYEVCQSVNTGIPALIKSNKKQYEFLRDKIFEI